MKAVPTSTPAGREAGTLSSLRALLDVAAVVRSRDDLLRLLEAVAATIAQELGFAAVIVNMYRPAWDDYEVVVAEDRDEAARQALIGRHVAPADLEKLLDDRFRRHGAYVVPHDQFDFASLDMTWVKGSVTGDGPDAWHPDDALLVPLTASDGRLQPAAGVGFDFSEGTGWFTAAALERMIAPELVHEGCVLLDSQTARALAADAGMPTVYTSRHNGRGPLAWDRHWLMVPLRDRAGALDEAEARAELRRGAGSQFDEPIVEAFLRVLQ